MRTTAIAAFAGCAMTAQIGVADPCEPVRIAPPSVVPPTDFGGRVAVDGDFWFISDANARVLCPGDPFSCSAGAVHVYEMVDGVLEHRQMLTAPMPRLGDFYGRTIAASQGRLAVGSINTHWPSVEAKGGAFIYEYDGERWVEDGSLSPPEGIDRFYTDQLGGFVAFEGDAAYLRPVNREFVFSYFQRDGVWTFHEMIENVDGLPREAGFGAPIITHESWVFISASRDSSLVRSGGSVYVYHREATGSLTLVQKIVPTDAPGGVENTQGFGKAVSFDGQTLAIGAVSARRSGVLSGAVLLYELVDGVWTFQQELVHPSAESGDALGCPVSIHGDVLIATAGDQVTAVVPAALHLFRRGIDGQWRYVQQLVPNPPIYASNYASSIVTDGRWALAGALDDSDGTSLRPGAAYQFDLACTGCRTDLDGDGTLTIFDFLTFLNLFQDGDPIADFDGDGELTIFDFLAFQTAFDAGCE